MLTAITFTRLPPFCVHCNVCCLEDRPSTKFKWSSFACTNTRGLISCSLTQHKQTKKCLIDHPTVYNPLVVVFTVTATFIYSSFTHCTEINASGGLNI